jgi:phosphonate transport system permease protein
MLHLRILITPSWSRFTTMTRPANTPTQSPTAYRLPAALQRFLLLLLLALLCLWFADIEISSRNPMLELNKMLQGLLKPSFLAFDELLYALAQTLSYAIIAVSVSAAIGLLLSLYYQHNGLRAICAALRSVHELFWGLLFLQLLGIHPLAGILAIALPYSGIFAKVFAEIREEYQAPAVLQAVPAHSSRLSIFCYSQWPQLWPHIKSYTLYRMECGLRSSTVLGFIGLPTLGFQLETSFMQGLYSQTAGLLLIIIGLIATLRWWLNFKLLPLYLFAASLVLAGAFWPQPELNPASFIRFISDLTPAPLRQDLPLLPWLATIGSQQLLPGIINTLMVAQIALLGTALLALLFFPLVSRQFFSKPLRFFGHGGLIVLRSIPELVIAFALLLLWGPSMLPAIVALAIHNGAIIANLLGQYSNQLQLRVDASQRLNRYSYEILPRIYGQFLAFLCYRWEVILRESAILGILGVHTLGFYIDSAFESFRLDVAALLIACSALLNILVDQLSRLIRHRLHLQTAPDSRTPAPW